jgi:hypothetical protein
MPYNLDKAKPSSGLAIHTGKRGELQWGKLILKSWAWTEKRLSAQHPEMILIMPYVDALLKHLQIERTT